MIREAQKQVGELLWTVTRTRPDLMYAVSKMGSAVLRNPKMVNVVADQVKGYILQTEGEGLCFTSDSASNPFLEVFTDASYGDHAHGCVIAFLFGSPMLWKSGKQGTASMSTAEAELQEMVEGMVAGESTFVLARELFPEMVRVLWTDSQSAQSIMTSEGGSWRTRHLRLRAAHARMRVMSGEWAVRHVPGLRMVSDIGTKPLTSTRLQFLKEEMGMWLKTSDDGPNPKEVAEVQNREEEDQRFEAEVQSLEGIRVGNAARALKLLTMAAMIQVGRTEEDPEGGDDYFPDIEVGILIYTILVIAGTWWLTRRWLTSTVGLNEQESSGDYVDEHVENGLGTLAVQVEGDLEPEEHAESVLGTLAAIQAEGNLVPVEVMRSAEVGEEVEVRLVRPPPFHVIITPYGRKYHLSVSCCTLFNSSRRGLSMWCASCSRRTDEKAERVPFPTVWSRGPGALAHLDRECVFMGGDAGEYQLCIRCPLDGL